MRNRALLLVTCASLISARPDPSSYRGWPVTGGVNNMHYSALKQINSVNVTQLKVAWQFDSKDEYDRSEMECNPIVVNGVLYATTPRLRVVALDAGTGKLRWDFDPHRGEKRSGTQRNRGLNYWSDGKQARIFAGIDEFLYALDAQTGQMVKDFGDNGRVDLTKGLGRDDQQLMVRLTSPGVVYRDLLILGSLVAEDLPAAPGHIRAYDVRTGKMRWIFHTIPQPGEFGYGTWPKDAWSYTGGVNAWAGLVLDEKRGLVYAPTGSAAFDFYGANRVGNDLFANCMIALKADTGERLWHFQAVHHDLWDRDFPSAPMLVQVRRDGRLVDAVAQITKSGFVWVFDRDTGKPLFPYQEIAVPQTDMDGEQTSAKQVLPTEPAPFARQQLTEDMLTNRTPEAHAAALKRFREVRSGPQFTPPSREGTVIFPGFDGGGEWGGAAWDPETGLFYVNANEMAWILKLVPRSTGTGMATGQSLYTEHCSGCHRPDRSGSPPEFPSLIDIGRRHSKDEIVATLRRGASRMPAFASLGAARLDAIAGFLLTGESKEITGPQLVQHGPEVLKYGMDGYNKFLDADGYPAIAPPWGTLNAIDLNTGKYAWKIPFGQYPELAHTMPDSGSENYGGGVVTAGGLFIIAATTRDSKLRAFDKSNGKLLWEALLPAPGNATPAVYEWKGREYVVIGCGGGKGGPSGGSYVAYALP
jgi:quinoprotein glucose dehydrogenase